MVTFVVGLWRIMRPSHFAPNPLPLLPHHQLQNFVHRACRANAHVELTVHNARQKRVRSISISTKRDSSSTHDERIPRKIAAGANFFTVSTRFIDLVVPSSPYKTFPFLVPSTCDFFCRWRPQVGKQIKQEPNDNHHSKRKQNLIQPST